MRLRIQEQLLCCLFVVILFLSGMCVEIPHADASFLYTQEASVSNATGGVIRDGSRVAKIERVCTISTLGRGAATFLNGNKMRDLMKRVRDAVAFLAATMLLSYLFCFGRVTEDSFWKLTGSHDTIVRYIQQTDGKK